MRSGRRAPRSGTRPAARRSATSPSRFPNVRSERDVSRLAQEVFALPGAARRRRAAQGRRRARRVPGDRRLQRRLGRARAARRGAASARGRLRVRRLGAEPDGADARAEAAVLQGRSGDAAREDSGRRVRRVHRRALRALGHEAGGRARRRRSSSWPATCPTTCSGSRTKPGTKCARGGRRRATLDDLHQALTRLLAEQQMMFEAVWQRLTLAQRGVLRAVVLEEGRELLSADVRAAPSARRRVERAGRARRAAARRSHQPRRRPLRRRRLAAARVGRAADVLDFLSCRRARKRVVHVVRVRRQHLLVRLVRLRGVS